MIVTFTFIPVRHNWTQHIWSFDHIRSTTCAPSWCETGYDSMFPSPASNNAIGSDVYVDLCLYVRTAIWNEGVGGGGGRIARFVMYQVQVVAIDAEFETRAMIFHIQTLSYKFKVEGSWCVDPSQCISSQWQSTLVRYAFMLFSCIPSFSFVLTPSSLPCHL